MHPRIHNKTREITKLILTAVAGGVGVTLLAFMGSMNRRAQYARNKAIEGILTYTRARILENLRRLRMQKHIAFNENDPRSPIVLTEKGMIQLLRLRWKERIHGSTKRWDYLWRMIIFDIPEEERSTRVRLRRTLQDSGFFQLQKSVFITPFACEKEVEELCELWQLQRCAHVFVTASLGSAEKRARIFFMHAGMCLPRPENQSS